MGYRLSFRNEIRDMRLEIKDLTKFPVSFLRMQESQLNQSN
jgi:hypothetical protein